MKGMQVSALVQVSAQLTAISHFLRELSNHEDETEVVHAKGNVEESVDVGQEDDVFDGILNHLGVLA